MAVGMRIMVPDLGIGIYFWRCCMGWIEIIPIPKIKITTMMRKITITITKTPSQSPYLRTSNNQTKPNICPTSKTPLPPKTPPRPPTQSYTSPIPPSATAYPSQPGKNSFPSSTSRSSTCGRKTCGPRLMINCWRIGWGNIWKLVLVLRGRRILGGRCWGMGIFWLLLLCLWGGLINLRCCLRILSKGLLRIWRQFKTIANNSCTTAANRHPISP